MSVILSSYSFDVDHPPTISTAETMMADRYQLRAKFHLPTSFFQAARRWNNNGAFLDYLPPPGTYVVDLYWLQWDDTDGTLDIGPFNTVSVTVTLNSDAVDCREDGITSTDCACGEFEEPEVADAGGCHPASVKRPCDAPLPPQAECGELNFTVESLPGEDPPFVITSQLFDESCEAILDEGGNPILTIVA